MFCGQRSMFLYFFISGRHHSLVLLRLALIEILTCMFCRKKEHNGTNEKYRICTEGRATDLQKAATDLMDEVYTRICDLKTNANIFSAD